MNETDVELDLETRGHDHVEDLLGALREKGYRVEVLV
jgi:threonine dehydratase